MVPDPKTSGRFIGVAFSPDGKTVWASRWQRGEKEPKVVQRKPGSSGWEPLRAKIPGYPFPTEKLWLSPKGDELWMGSWGNGLLRAKLASGEVTQYVQSDYRRQDSLKHYTLAGDYVHDLVFASRGRIVVCSAGGGRDEGITQIDLATGDAANYPTESPGVEKLVVAPDDRTVWCIFNNSLLWAFDVQTRSWTHKCSAKQGMPLDYFRTLECSPDGAFVWLRGPGGAAVYCVRRKSWKGFVGEDWACDADDTPLCVTADGKHVVCGHRQGVALIKIDGSDYSVLSPGADATNCPVSHIVPIPRTGDYVCFVYHLTAGGLYYVDVGRRSLRKLKDPIASTVSAMAVGPDGLLWGASDRQYLLHESFDRRRACWPSVAAMRRTDHYALPSRRTAGHIQGRGCAGPGVQRPCRGPP